MPPRVVDVLPGRQTNQLLGAAIDIGTTSNVVYLVDLLTGKLMAEAVDYNGQITRGEDVISRIIYAGKNDGLDRTAKPRGRDAQSSLASCGATSKGADRRKSSGPPWPATAR